MRTGDAISSWLPLHSGGEGHYWLQAYFENRQVLLPASHLRRNSRIWQALEEELILFPSAEHDDLFDALQTMMEGAMTRPISPRARWVMDDEEPVNQNRWGGGYQCSWDLGS